MRKATDFKSACLLLSLFAAGALGLACDLNLPGSTTTIQTVTQTNGGASPGPAVSPSPGAGDTCPGAAIVDRIRVGPFGIECPDGIPEPNNNDGILPVGCRAHVTATPKKADGSDVPSDLHGTGISWLIVSGAQYIRITPDSNQDFNHFVDGVSGPGEFVLAATVCGKTGQWVARTVIP